MRIIRFYYPHQLLARSEIVLEGEAFHHAVHVLRCKKGSILELFDGQGVKSQGKIIELNRRSATIFLLDSELVSKESALNTILIQAISKGERMDYCLQKATELGVSVIHPVISDRCNVQLDEQRWKKRFLHWQKIIISACEQCGRNRLPSMTEPSLLQPSLESFSSTENIFLLHPKNSLSFSQVKPKHQTLGFIVGPEGGFSDQEVDNIRKMGVKSVSLGPRILRSETSPVVALSIAQSRWGDID